MERAEEKESKKRKLTVCYDDDDNDVDEEEKIQTFFSLIRNMERAHHDIIAMNNLQVKKKQSMDQTETEHMRFGPDSGSTSWQLQPRFKTQDLVDSDHNIAAKFPADFAGTAVPGGGGDVVVKYGTQSGICEDGVDLKLSL